MKMETFEMERMQSTWENVVEFDLSESGVYPVSLKDLQEMGLDIEELINTPIGYSQSNGTIELRELLTAQYPGATIDHIEVTNGTSEANYIVCQTLVEPGDEVVFQVPNYMQLHALSRSWGATTRHFAIRHDKNWEPDWDEFEQALSNNTKFIYITNPNNPTGSILSKSAMKRIIEGIDRSGAYLIADEVYQGAELDGNLTPSFWGMSDRIIVTSGLSKAYSIPGVRIGWIVGPPEIVAECWRRHDLITIGPNKLSDMIARVAVRPENRKKLYARTAQILGSNKEIFKRWVESFDDFFDYIEPKAGAMAFVKYNAGIPSIELVDRIRVKRDVLVVPGAHLGLEGFIRINIGPPREIFEKALARIKAEIDEIRAAV